MSTAFVSGANGFIGAYVTKELLDKGYKVIGSVRTEETKQKYLKAFNNSNLTLVIVKDISVLGAFDDVFKKYSNKIDYVFHVASPFFLNATDYEKQLFVPAVNGTLSILQAIQKYAPTSVKHVVVTSSVVATRSPKQMTDPNVTMSETSWNEDERDGKIVDGNAAYFASKKFAEQAAWKFYHDNDVNFKMNTIHPAFVFGPQLFDFTVNNHMNTSSQFINELLHLKPTDDFSAAGFEFSEYPSVDVRDIAKAEVLSVENSKFDDHRVLVIDRMAMTKDFMDIIYEDFPQTRGKLPRGTDADLKARGKHACKLDQKQSLDILNFKKIGLKQCIDDTVEQLIRVQKLF